MQSMGRFSAALSSVGFIAASLGCGSEGKGSGAAGMGGAPPELVLHTDSGPVHGTVSGHTRVFAGIPFAAPPVGSLRWRPPQAPSPWTEPLDATQLGPNCPQIPLGASGYDPSTREDCLTLNVW